MLANNFNIMLLIQLLPLFVLLVIVLLEKGSGLMLDRLKNKENELLDKNKEIESLDKSKMRIESFSSLIKNGKNYANEVLMFMSSFNVACFVSSTVLYFQLSHNNHSGNNGPNYVVLALASIAYLYCYVMFWRDPYSFDYFKQSFKKQSPGTYHFCIYTVFIIITTLTICILPQVSFIPLFPVLAILIFTISSKPFNERK
jgi:hypothetical protein